MSNEPMTQSEAALRAQLDAAQKTIQELRAEGMACVHINEMADMLSACNKDRADKASQIETLTKERDQRTADLAHAQCETSAAEARAEAAETVLKDLLAYGSDRSQINETCMAPLYAIIQAATKCLNTPQSVETLGG